MQPSWWFCISTANIVSERDSLIVPNFSSMFSVYSVSSSSCKDPGVVFCWNSFSIVFPIAIEFLSEALFPLSWNNQRETAVSYPFDYLLQSSQWWACTKLLWAYCCSDLRLQFCCRKLHFQAYLPNFTNSTSLVAVRIEIRHTILPAKELLLSWVKTFYSKPSLMSLKYQSDH